MLVSAMATIRINQFTGRWAILMEERSRLRDASDHHCSKRQARFSVVADTNTNRKTLRQNAPSALSMAAIPLSRHACCWRQDSWQQHINSPLALVAAGVIFCIDICKVPLPLLSFFHMAAASKEGVLFQPAQTAVRVIPTTGVDA